MVPVIRRAKARGTGAEGNHPAESAPRKGQHAVPFPPKLIVNLQRKRGRTNTRARSAITIATKRQHSTVNLHCDFCLLHKRKLHNSPVINFDDTRAKPGQHHLARKLACLAERHTLGDRLCASLCSPIAAVIFDCWCWPDQRQIWRLQPGDKEERLWPLVPDGSHRTCNTDKVLWASH